MNHARDPVLYDPLNCNVNYMVRIIETCKEIFLCMTNKLSFFSRSDANRDKVDLHVIFKQLSFRSVVCFILQSNSWVNQVDKTLE